MTFSLYGKDKTASKALKNVGDTSERVGKKIGRVGTAFAGIGTAAVAAGAFIAVDFAQKSIDAFKDAQLSAAKFDDAFARFPSLSNYKGQLDELAVSLSLVTKYDDDVTKASVAVLAKFGLTGEQLKELVPLTQDFASATGRDLVTSSELLGKATLGNAKALKTLGISFKPTGDKAKDFATITQMLRDKVGGFAEKEGKTAAGTSDILANQFGELQEQVGGWLVPVLQKLSRWVLDSVIPAIKSLADWVSSSLMPVLGELWSNFTTNILPVMVAWWKILTTQVWPALQKLWAVIASNLQPAVEALGTFWRDTLQPAFVKAWPAIQLVGKAIAIVAGITLVLVSKIVGFLVPAITGIIGWFVKMGTKAQEIFGNIVTWASNLVTWFKALPEKISKAVVGMWDGLKSSFRAAINWIIGKWNDFSLTVGGGEFLGKTLPSVTLDTPNIPYLARGGITTGPTLAMIGDNPGGREAVIPLPARGGLGTTVNVYVTQPLGTPTEIARAIGAAVKRATGNGTATR
jgi:hypothetical protein